MKPQQQYEFVGSDHIRASAARGGGRWRITTGADVTLAADALTPKQPELAVTYTITADGSLWIASLRSEHYACAQGQNVLAAGEMTFVRHGGGWAITEINNRSTGYCPEPSCWSAAQDTLRATGIPHPDGFTDSFEFRLCPACGNTNLIKDAYFVCACGHDLPATWNFKRPSDGRGETIYFSRIKGPYGCLPNFAPLPIALDGEHWPTSEHYYQAQKFTDPALREAVRSQPTPHDAAVFARARPSELRPDWDNQQLAVMEKVLVAKAQQHPAVVKALLQSGDALLVEKSPRDAFWGDGPDGNGANHLGKLWMRIREDLKTGRLPR